MASELFLPWMELQCLVQYLQETFAYEQEIFSCLAISLLEIFSEMSDLAIFQHEMVTSQTDEMEAFQTDGMETFQNDELETFQNGELETFHFGELETFAWERLNSQLLLLLLQLLLQQLLGLGIYENFSLAVEQKP
jgi:hypothetical protein